MSVRDRLFCGGTALKKNEAEEEEFRLLLPSMRVLECVMLYSASREGRKVSERARASVLIVFRREFAVEAEAAG